VCGRRPGWRRLVRERPIDDARALGYDTRFGRGWISGVVAVVLGALALGAVLCLRFPALLTTPDARALYPMGVVRFLIHLVLVTAFGLGVLSIVLSRRTRLGLIGIGLTVAALLLGGSQVEVTGPIDSARYVGLDWFCLNLFVLALLFVPLEMACARTPQGVFRRGWLTDLCHFGVSHLAVQLTVLLTLVPAALFFRWAVHPGIQAAVAGQPLVLQFAAIVVVADLSEYTVHRLFHRVPLLWRFHAIHHSSTTLDWLAASRIHLVDAVVTRALGFVPLYVLGFAPPAVYAYLVFVSFHAIFVHTNVRFTFGRLAWLIGTPRFHHWHHSAQPEAVDKNFAVHLPLIDRLFGTLHLPERGWPTAYGIAGGAVPEPYPAQLVFPFTRRPVATLG
jgi:sterol desaturase/sphingolipid hydroxylase (fatty acid hydroxylase superfamily)